MLKKLVLSLLGLCLIAPAFSQIVINEYSASNWKEWTDDYLKHEDWLELYNNGPSDVDISGFYLSDDKNVPEKFQIPAGTVISANSHFIFWCSGRNSKLNPNSIHTNFKLTQTKTKAEDLTLSSPSLVKIDQVKVKNLKYHSSFGRTLDGGNTWGIFTNDSPGTSNNSSIGYTGYASRPEFNIAPGYYSSTLSVEITAKDNNTTIFYTLNGSEPEVGGTLYSGPIEISSTSVLKAVAFSSDPQTLPSYVQFGTYFVNVSHSVVVVSISGDQLDVLANGDNSLRPIGTMEYFGIDKDRKARGYGEFNSHGQDSWANDQRSLDFIMRDEMGYNYAILEKMFPMTDRDEFQRVILRAAGDDNYPAAHHPQNEGSAHIRDAYIHNLAKKGGMNVDVREAQKCVVYLNGAYWGVYDLREIPDDHDYTDFNYGQGKYDLQYLLTWGNTWAEYGDQKALDDWTDFYVEMLAKDMKVQANFDWVAQQYDTKSLVDYVLINAFTVCSDWLNYNTGWWRGLNPEGTHQKWGYILWDNDATFGHYINYTGIPNTNYNADPCDVEKLANWSDPKGHTKILKHLRKNPGFNQYYLSRTADMLNTTFSCDNMLNELDSVVAILQPEMTQHAERWFGTYEGWMQNVNKLRDFIELRCAYFATGMKNCYDLDGPYPLTIQSTAPDQANVLFNSLTINQFPWTGSYFGGLENLVSINYNANSTLPFKNWIANNGSILPDSKALSIEYEISKADTLTAVFAGSVKTEEEGIIGQISLFPTVSNGQMTLDLKLDKSSNLKAYILSSTGVMISNLKDISNIFSAGNHQLTINLQEYNLPSGSYYLCLQEGELISKVHFILANN